MSDAFGSEVHALAAAVTTAADLGVVRAIFETDSELLAEAMDAHRVDFRRTQQLLKIQSSS